MDEQIGIKLADGSFYPLLKVGMPACKTLELTTANDNQTAISVDLYRTKTGGMTDAELVETLRLENLPAHSNGALTISLCVELDENEVLSSDLRELESDAHCNKIVSLTSLTADVSSSNDLILDAPDTSQDIDLSSLVLPDPVPGESEDADWSSDNPLILPDPAPDESDDDAANANLANDGLADVTNDVTTRSDFANELPASIVGSSPTTGMADDAANANLANDSFADVTNDVTTHGDFASDTANVAVDLTPTDVINDVTTDDDFANLADALDGNLEESDAPLDFENTSVDTTNTLGGEEVGAANVIDSSAPQESEIDFALPDELPETSPDGAATEAEDNFAPPDELLAFDEPNEYDSESIKKNSR